MIILSNIMTKHCLMSVAAAQDWDTSFPSDRYCYVELQFWRDYLRRVITRGLSSCNSSFISVFSDASDVVCGGHVYLFVICLHFLFCTLFFFIGMPCLRM